ncbi:MAG: L-threonylcarbamoyladenylate synthase [Alphaproteobacteria bacterium]
MTKIITPTDNAIKQAAQILKSGGLVGMPTETVYGLAANALDGKGVARVFEVKGRPAFNPLILHCASMEMAENYAEFNETARILAHHFWPGPLTIIMPRKKSCAVSELVSAGLDTLAVRVPDHPVALKLIEVAGVPLAAPSANRSGSLSPTTPAHVSEALGNDVDIILAAGACAVGLESTVLHLSEQGPVIVRAGAITAEDIETATGLKTVYDTGDKDKPLSPGQLLKHYAPAIPLRMNAVDVAPGEGLLAFGSIKFMGVRGAGAAKDLPPTMFRNLSENSDLHEAAANLFAMIRQLDNPAHTGIAVMSVPNQGLGIAINDRLHRASS